jgi:hypothetical protein
MPYKCGAGHLLLVLMLWTTQGLDAKKKPPLHPVNLNTASSAELQQESPAANNPPPKANKAKPPVAPSASEEEEP